MRCPNRCIAHLEGAAEMKKPSPSKPGDFEITDSKTAQAAADILAGSSRKRGLAPPAAVPGPGVHRQRGLHGPRQLRHQHPGRARSSATSCSGWSSPAT